MNAPIIAAEEEGRKSPNLELAQLLHKLEKRIKRGGLYEDLKSQIISFVEIDTMGPFITILQEKYNWVFDEAFITSINEKNKKELEELQNKQEDVIKNAGDLELLDILSKKGRYYSRIGDFIQALLVFDEILNKPKTGTGRKIDACFDKAKIHLFNGNIKGLKDILAEASKFIEIGGDWDRRNKLKVFEAIYSMQTRDLAKAATLLHDGIATFSSTDLFSYNQFIFYAILTNVLALSRNDLKKKIIDNAHVISVIIEAPKLQSLINSLYSCDYRKLMRTLLDVEEDILDDRYLGPHTVHILREYRILAFSQFLEAYKSVLLSSMASSFGVSTAILDRELAHFIAAGRLNAKIDKVGDVVETVKSDKRNAQYQDVIKKGDLLLNQVQKLVRQIDQ